MGCGMSDEQRPGFIAFQTFVRLGACEEHLVLPLPGRSQLTLTPRSWTERRQRRGGLRTYMEIWHTMNSCVARRYGECGVGTMQVSE